MSNIEQCICQWIDVGVGYTRVSNEPGCPIHFPLPDEDMDSLEETVDFIRQKLDVQRAARQALEARHEMLIAKLRLLKTELENMDKNPESWVAHELDGIISQTQ